jgi:hypothetical protein
VCVMLLLEESGQPADAHRCRRFVPRPTGAKLSKIGLHHTARPLFHLHCEAGYLSDMSDFSAVSGEEDTIPMMPQRKVSIYGLRYFFSAAFATTIAVVLAVTLSIVLSPSGHHADAASNPTTGITVHILDTSTGLPATAVGVELEYLDSLTSKWDQLTTSVTNTNGRCEPLWPINENEVSPSTHPSLDLCLCTQLSVSVCLSLCLSLPVLAPLGGIVSNDISNSRLFPRSGQAFLLSDGEHHLQCHQCLWPLSHPSHPQSLWIHHLQRVLGHRTRGGERGTGGGRERERERDRETGGDTQRTQ